MKLQSKYKIIFLIQFITGSLTAFFGIIAYALPFFMTFRGYGSPSLHLTRTGEILILSVFLLPLLLMIFTYIKGIQFLIKEKAPKHRYVFSILCGISGFLITILLVHNFNLLRNLLIFVMKIIFWLFDYLPVTKLPLP